MQKTNLKNVLLQALKPKRFSVMTAKVRKRFFDGRGDHTELENRQWLSSSKSDFRTFAEKLDPELWGETEEVSIRIQEHSDQVLNQLNVQLGGGGVYPLIYFITRLLQPECIVETGVAAGFSTYAFLAAIEQNHKGKLYSSDFPYFRLENPEKYIGIVVEDSLKSNWELFIEGDDVNLPLILNKIKKIDLFHYDSDKSYLGRKNVMNLIEDSLSKNAVILMDDIQDNSFFYDYISRNNIKDYKVFEFNNKFIGMIGKLD